MARKGRDYAAEYRRRQAKARSLGYENYYSRRIRLGKPPSAPAPTGQELRQARGHASAADLVRTSRPGDILSVEWTQRDEGGRLERVDIVRVGEIGEEDRFSLRGDQLDEDELSDLLAELDDIDVDFLPDYDLHGLYAAAA